MNDFNESSSGLFKVSAFTANRALPIEGAKISVYERGGSVPIYTLFTDRSGETELLSLIAPAASGSLSPSDKRPFADYSVRVEADGFYTLFIDHLPIFAGIISDLPASLIPLSAYDASTTLPSEEIYTVTKNPQALSEESV